MQRNEGQEKNNKTMVNFKEKGEIKGYICVKRERDNRSRQKREIDKEKKRLVEGERETGGHRRREREREDKVRGREGEIKR